MKNVISSIYLISITYLMNFQLVKDAVFGDHTVSYKVNLLTALPGGSSLLGVIGSGCAACGLPSTCLTWFIRKCSLFTLTGN